MTEPLRLMLWHWGRRGGGPRYTMELARALAPRPGVELHLSLSRQSELFHETDAIGARSFHVDTYRTVPMFMMRAAALPRIRARFLAYLAQHRIAVVYNTLDFLFGAAIAPAIRRTGSLYLLAVHDAERHPGENGRLRQMLLRRDIAAADAAITMTDAVGEQLVALHGFPPQRAWTAPLGAFLDTPNGRVRVLPSHRPIRLLFFGRIMPYKGLDLLLEALALIRRQRLDVELEIWGSGDIAPYWPALAKAEGVRLEHRWLAEDEIAAVFDRTDLCVLPYREASQSAVIATALTAGMPIVTTPIPGLVEQIDHGRAGRIADDISPEGFARAVLDIVSDPDGYARLSQGAIAHGRSVLSWPLIADRIEDVARRLVAMGPRRPA